MFDKRLISLFVLFYFLNLKAQFGDSFPILKFDQDTVDFGVVNEGDTVIYDFWFTNVGTKNLRIRQAYPACGCTYPTYEDMEISPGERGKIHVEFYSQGWGGKTVVKEAIILLVNGPENYARFKAKIVNKTFEQDLDSFKKEQEGKLDSSKTKGRSKRKKHRKDKLKE
jgi:hypothetical protein